MNKMNLFRCILICSSILSLSSQCLKHKTHIDFDFNENEGKNVKLNFQIFSIFKTLTSNG